jgi:hypothetical protein
MTRKPDQVQGKSYMARHQAWKKGQLQAIAEENASVARRLLNEAPADLRLFLREISAAQSLLDCGRLHIHFHPSEVVEQYEFRSFADFKRQMKALAEAWKDVVKVKVGKYDDTKKSLWLDVI